MRRVTTITFLGVAILIATCLPLYAANKVTQITGKVESIRVKDAGMNFYYLITQNGTQIFLGAPFKVNEDPAKNCVAQSAENEIEVTLAGVLIKEGGDYSFQDDKFTCVNKSSVADTYPNGYGPKIFGLQLGMSRNEAKSVIEQYAKKHNLKYDGKDTSLYNDKGKILDVAFLSSEQAKIYFVGNQAFQVDNMDDKGFLQALLNKYDIPEVKPEKYQSPFGNGVKYVYTDNSAGFRLEVFHNYLTVTSIPKKSNKPAVFE